MHGATDPALLPLALERRERTSATPLSTFPQQHPRRRRVSFDNPYLAGLAAGQHHVGESVGTRAFGHDGFSHVIARERESAFVMSRPRLASACGSSKHPKSVAYPARRGYFWQVGANGVASTDLSDFLHGLDLCRKARAQSVFFQLQVVAGL